MQLGGRCEPDKGFSSAEFSVLQALKFQEVSVLACSQVRQAYVITDNNCTATEERCALAEML
jgi:hypothetical protein